MDKKLIKFRNNVLGDVSSRQYLKTPYLVFAMSILLTVAVTYLFYLSVDAKDRARFTNDVTKINSTIEGRLNAYITLLKSSRGFLEAIKTSGGQEVTKDSFAVFIKGLELEQFFQGAQGIGFIKRVQPGERAALAEKMRAEGHKDFTIFPAETADKEGYIILYLEPLAKDLNARGIGYVLSSEAPKLATIEKAAATGEPAISEKLIFIPLPITPESPRRPGFQLFVPMYKGGQIPDTSEKRKEALESLIYCPFRAVNFIAEVQKISSVSDVSFAIYDQEIKPENLLGESVAETKNLNTNSNSLFWSQTVYNNLRYEEATVSTIGNEKWIVKYQTLPSFHSNSSAGWTLIIFFFGMGISLILFFITLSQSKAHTNLEYIAQNLASSERVKDEFISVVSHELRTPLNSIAGGVTILKNQNASEETRAKALDIIDKNLRSQANLVEDMIVFSDINAGKDYLQIKPINISLLVQQTFNAFFPQTEKKNISFSKQDGLNGQMVAGDEAKLDRVLHSILSNSIKFTSPGGAINIETKDLGENVEIKIKDNGFGIHPQVLPYVFDLFKQGDSSTIRRHGGLGLGLTLARHIIKLHGGTLEAESLGVDKGAAFILTLPVIAEQK